MKWVFVDTNYYIAMLNERDSYHERAKAISTTLRERTVTTSWVLVEVLGFLAKPDTRRASGVFVRSLLVDSRTEVMPANQALFDEGLALFLQHNDKAWSLVDCISFVVMRKRRIREALTADHHFAQAGFVPLLAQ